MKLWQELRRRRLFRLAGIYIVGAWVAIQVGATFFPAWGIPRACRKKPIAERTVSTQRNRGPMIRCGST